MIEHVIAGLQSYGDSAHFTFSHKKLLQVISSKAAGYLQDPPAVYDFGVLMQSETNSVSGTELIVQHTDSGWNLVAFIDLQEHDIELDHKLSYVPRYAVFNWFIVNDLTLSTTILCLGDRAVTPTFETTRVSFVPALLNVAAGFSNKTERKAKKLFMRHLFAGFFMLKSKHLLGYRFMQGSQWSVRIMFGVANGLH